MANKIHNLPLFCQYTGNFAISHFLALFVKVFDLLHCNACIRHFDNYLINFRSINALFCRGVNSFNATAVHVSKQLIILVF